MKTSARPLLAALAALLSTPFAFAADTVPAQYLGTGDELPDATLYRADGSPVDLSREIAKTPAVLIFYRGGWCPYCNMHLADLVDIEDELTAMGMQLLAISPDRPEKLRDAPKRKVDPTYELLSDSDMKLCDALGISHRMADDMFHTYKDKYNIDLEAASDKTHHKLPHPAVYIVGTDGIIRFAHVDPDYKKRLDPKKIVEAARLAREG